ncbi:MAG: hypothetical protein LDLANPLL_01071 [Turneriella sp.]|nr:hypothetical protein [Turneriella sp.]
MELAAAFELFRRGNFLEARNAALEIADREPQNFWAWYLSALSAAFEPDVKAFEEYLSELKSFSVENIYLHYLKAYYALLQNDVEKALWYYLQIVDGNEGWLARALVKKFRKIKTIENIAFHAADYIVLPPELPPPVTIEPSLPSSAVYTNIPNSSKTNKAEQKKYFFSLRKKKFLLKTFLGLLLLVSSAIVISLWYTYRTLNENSAANFQIADFAAVMPIVDPQATLYTYHTREGIISDFEKAKTKLKEKKINQARYILNRLINSNADFQSREKSRVFLGFIPDVPYTDFNDNVALNQLLKYPKFYVDSLLVFSGSVRDVAKDPNGQGSNYRLIVHELGQDYLVHVFKSEKVLEESNESSNNKSDVQFYGRFKGLVGEQKAIYFEALRVWR